MRSHSVIFFFFKQRTAYERRISDWSSDVCSSDLLANVVRAAVLQRFGAHRRNRDGHVGQKLRTALRGDDDRRIVAVVGRRVGRCVLRESRGCDRRHRDREAARARAKKTGSTKGRGFYIGPSYTPLIFFFSGGA